MQNGYYTFMVSIRIGTFQQCLQSQLTKNDSMLYQESIIYKKSTA